MYKTAEVVREAGGKITREPGPLPGINTKILACVDPDGWKTVSLCAERLKRAYQVFWKRLLWHAFVEAH